MPESKQTIQALYLIQSRINFPELYRRYKACFVNSQWRKKSESYLKKFKYHIQKPNQQDIINYQKVIIDKLHTELCAYCHYIIKLEKELGYEDSEFFREDKCD